MKDFELLFLTIHERSIAFDMTIDTLLNELDPGTELSIDNTPFMYAGQAKITLEGGDVRVWLYSQESSVLSISPDDEELVYFRLIDEQLDTDGDFISFQNEEYEFSYEDVGVVSDVDGDVEGDEHDRLSFMEYESEDSGVIRVVLNENTGEKHVYLGQTITESDIVEVE